MKSFGLILILTGGAIALLGAILLLVDKVPFLGRLPGDIRVEGRNTSFYFPIVTCVVISIVLTLILNVVLKLLRK